MRIEYGYTPKVLLLGNGINRAYDFASWAQLISSIQTKVLSEDEQESLKKVPYTLQPVILTENHVDEKLKQISAEITALCATPEEAAVLHEFASLPFDSILTANYTYELERAINPNFCCVTCRACKARKTADIKAGKLTVSQLHTYFQLEENGMPIWHIHGEAAKPDTMVLGHYYYGMLLAKIQQHIPKLMARYRGNVARKQGLICQSWIDYFMLGDVYIVGLGMDLSEMDLWWLVNCKKRNFPDTRIILYKPDITMEQQLLAEAYGISVVKDGLNDDDYRAYYQSVCRRIATELESKKSGDIHDSNDETTTE